MNTNQADHPNVWRSFQRWGKMISPVFGIAVMGIFVYWIRKGWDMIVSVFLQVGLPRLAGLILLLFLSGILTVLAFTHLVRAKGYPFRFLDGYHTLNYSQLASIIPGGIWGFAGLAGALWSKGVSKADSALVIVLNTIIMLTACAVVGIAGLASTFGWGFALISLLPFLFLTFGRNWLDRLRRRFLPESSQLPSTRALFETLLIGIAVWAIASLCFAWLLFANTEPGAVPLWMACGAYATGYLGGYLALFAPSGLGVSEGLVTLLLGPAIGTEKVLSVAISFRIVTTLVIWGNIIATVFLTSRKVGFNSVNPQ